MCFGTDKTPCNEFLFTFAFFPFFVHRDSIIRYALGVFCDKDRKGKAIEMQSINFIESIRSTFMKVPPTQIKKCIRLYA